MRSEYADDFEAFNRAFNRENYLYYSGRKPRLELEPVYDRYGELFRRDAIDEIRRDAEEGFLARDRKASRFLLAAAVEQHGEAAVRTLTEEIAAHDAGATVEWAGSSVPFYSVYGMMAGEARADERRELSSRRDRVLEEVNDLRGERLAKLYDVARSLGAESYAALHADLRGVDYAALSARCVRLLSDTERPYAEALEPVLRDRASVRLGDAIRADLLHAFRLPELDRAFPGRRMSVHYRDALAGLGIRTGAQANIALDLGERPTKSPRPFCSPVRIPEEIKLVVRPRGGYDDYCMLMHEAGHAQHFGFTSPEVRVAFRRAGDRATSETYAFLLQGLMRDADFLQEGFGLGHARALRTVAGLERCYAVRRYAAKMIYEEEIHSGRRALSAAPERYQELLAEATRVRFGRAEYLADVDDGFYTADYLRAWALEVQMRDALKTRFGRRWWANRGAGELLKELWSTGNEYTADELAGELGLGEISFDPLEEDMLEGLRP